MKKLDEKGNVIIIVCLMMSVILAAAAYALDIGLAYAEKAKLYNAIDSAALAGTMELPDDKDKARSMAVEYLNKNGVSESQADIVVGDKSIDISADKTVNYIFAPIIGINSSSVAAETQAEALPLKSVSTGIRPFAVQVFDFQYGTQIILKENAGDGYKGNYGAVALGGSGASVYEVNALYGYSGKISVGDYIDTEPGNMGGVANRLKNYINSEQSTFDNFPKNSIRLWTLPLVDSFQVNGRNQLLVSGFGEFYVEDVQNNSGQIEVTGRFIRYVVNGETDKNLKDTGAYAARLSK